MKTRKAIPVRTVRCTTATASSHSPSDPLELSSGRRNQQLRLLRFDPGVSLFRLVPVPFFTPLLPTSPAVVTHVRKVVV